MIADSPYAVLGSPHGRILLDALAEFDETHAAAAAQRARTLAPPNVAAAALATVFARRRARRSGKFDRPDVMLFTRAGYEQASSSTVARHRGARFGGLTNVFDLCCGIGSDTIALAGQARSVVAVDVDADVLACASHNAQAFGMNDRIKFDHTDVLEIDLAAADAVFADPARRVGNERVANSESYRPALSALFKRLHEVAGARWCVKVAPGFDAHAAGLGASLAGIPLEIEFVSEGGVCKEAALWCGAFARADGARRATVIDRDGTHELDGLAENELDAKPLAGYVGEPDGAVIRAGLIGTACVPAAAHVLDRHVAYVSAVQPVRSPFIRWYQVSDAMPFGVKRLRAYLRERGVGEVVIKTRAFPLRPEEIAALLKARGTQRAVVICTTIGSKKTAIVCEEA